MSWGYYYHLPRYWWLDSLHCGKTHFIKYLVNSHVQKKTIVRITGMSWIESEKTHEKIYLRKQLVLWWHLQIILVISITEELAILPAFCQYFKVNYDLRDIISSWQAHVKISQSMLWYRRVGYFTRIYLHHYLS